MTTAPGRLAVVGTPIGNLEDISRRAVRTLGEASVIFCEDTRRTRKLLSALGVPAPKLVRLDANNEDAMAGAVLAALGAGSVAALVTDAGMPAVSDPGSRLVAAVAAAGFETQVVPGPTAVSAALALAGLACGQYRFAGFLPRKGRDRSVLLDELAASTVTVVLYEAANRVGRTIADLAERCRPERPLVAAREMTKLHEEVWRGTVGEAGRWLESAGEPRGEWVLVLGAAAAVPAEPADVLSAITSSLEARLSGGEDRKLAVAEVAAELGVAKRQVYEVALDMKGRAGCR